MIPTAYSCIVSSQHHQARQAFLTISSATGHHLSGKNNSDVTAFWVYDRHFDFFPKGLDKIFENLEIIIFGDCGMKTIGRTDLKPFPKLIWFSLFINQIEVIEEGLFDNNPNLKYISLRENKIHRIYPKTFDNLAYLVTLRLSGNKCININADENRQQVMELIRQVKLKCSVPETTTEEITTTTVEYFDDEHDQGTTVRLQKSIMIIMIVTILYNLN